ncbi:hypothetical protein GCM10009760_25820 [Kitasatospora kazusensis]|uniref:Uncharacterized protein n=1 Tax=Kitasatospora kazusensis TaxID=407974 RepID=A0ABN2ZFR5_9ACTN
MPQPQHLQSPQESPPQSQQESPPQRPPRRTQSDESAVTPVRTSVEPDDTDEDGMLIALHVAYSDGRVKRYLLDDVSELIRY